jgi:site-specific recombinase XerD
MAFEWQDGRTLFCKRCGSRVTHIGNIKKTIRTIARAAGISQTTTHHMFRHAANTHTQQLGSKQHAAMELLGQETAQVNRLYLPVTGDEVVEATQTLGDSVGTTCIRAWTGLVGNLVESPVSPPPFDPQLNEKT